MLRKPGGNHDLHTGRRRGQRMAVTSLEGTGMLTPFILPFEMLIRLLATVQALPGKEGCSCGPESKQSMTPQYSQEASPFPPCLPLQGDIFHGSGGGFSSWSLVSMQVLETGASLAGFHPSRLTSLNSVANGIKGLSSGPVILCSRLETV